MILNKSNNFFVIASIFGCALLSCTSKRDLFTKIPSSQSNIAFVNHPVKNDHLNILYYLYYYNGGGVSAGEIKDDGLTGLYFYPNTKAHNKPYLHKAKVVF